MKKTDEEFVMEKAGLVAYLSLKNCHVTPILQDNGRVAFKVRGNVSEALAGLQCDPEIPILSYMNRLDNLRSIIFSFKKQANNGFQR